MKRESHESINSTVLFDGEQNRVSLSNVMRTDSRRSIVTTNLTWVRDMNGEESLNEGRCLIVTIEIRERVSMPDGYHNC